MTASSCHAKSRNERGWVLLSVLVISTLYFALIALVLWEATMHYRSAQRYRARVVAQTLAESAAELAAKDLLSSGGGRIEEEVDSGVMVAESTVAGNANEGSFHITAAGRASGVQKADATVEVWGRLKNGRVVITRTSHSQ